MADADTIRAVESWVPSAAAGDRDALTEILRLVHPLMVRYCAARLANADIPHTPEDVAQEICMAMIRSLPRYRDQGKSFLAFVYGIAAHKVADARRGGDVLWLRTSGEMPEKVCPEASPEDRVLAFERRGYVRDLMEVLSPTHREVLVLRIVMGWSAAQTAEALGTSAGVVRVMQHRALNRLRNEMRTRTPELIAV